MNRRLSEPTPPAVVVGSLAVLAAVAVAGNLYTRPQHKAAVKPASAYQTCLGAARTPGPSGFATEVCEPLMPGYVEPDHTDYVFTGPMTWTKQGAEVKVPGLAEDVADRCADEPGELLDCVAAILGERAEHDGGVS